MKNSSGFSLMELIIVVAIIGILTSIAFPSYQDSVTKSKRTDAKGLLLEALQQQESNFTYYNQYATDITTDAAPTKIALQTTSDNGHYSLTISAATTTGFLFSAAPQAPFTDAECGSYTINQLGLKGITGTGTVADCW